MAMRQLLHQVSPHGQKSSCRHHAAPYRQRTGGQGRHHARSVQGNPGPQAQATTLARQPAGSSRQQRARTAADLNDPAHIGASGQSSTTLKEYGEGATSLTTYMLLPVEQYFVLDPKQIKFLSGNRFLLAVPRIDILGVWLEAEVEVSVLSQGTPPMIVLRAENCRIRGSDAVENLRLDQRFCLKFVTELTWTSLPPASGSGPGTGQIFATTQVDVWCEVIPPFNLMPREVLEASCNVVMGSLVNSLLPLFVRRLGEDYEKWSQDSNYRVLRAQRKMPLS